jgi:hypothetical protein
MHRNRSAVRIQIAVVLKVSKPLGPWVSMRG